jgi:hypothetical protein
MEEVSQFLDTKLQKPRANGLPKRTRSIVSGAIVITSVLSICAVSGAGRGREDVVTAKVANRAAKTESVSKHARAESVSTRPVESPPIAAYFSQSRDSGFLDQPEQVILDKLIQHKVVEVKDSPGGRSVAFRVTLDDGTRGFYKPEQRFSSAHWYAEVVSYYLDRALGLKRVPPTVSRRLPWELFSRVAEKYPRKDEVVIADDGTVRGALIWWLPKRLVPLETPPGWENWVRIEPWPKWKISPCQRPKEYVDALAKQHASSGNGLQLLYYQTPEPDRPERAAELSDMLVFDFLTNNIDRWGGENCNVLLHGASGPLIYLDNGAGFIEGPARISLMDERFDMVQRFRRGTIEAIQNLDIKKFKQEIMRDRFAPLLTEQQLSGLETRRRAVLDRFSELKNHFGENNVLPWQ